MELTPNSSPDIARLLTLYAGYVREHGYSAVSAANIQAFIAGPGDAVLLFAEDPRKAPETWDVAVVLPDLLAAAAPTARVGLLDPASTRALSEGFDVTLCPTLLFFRDGQRAGAIERMRDWDHYLERIPQILSGAGLAVADTAGAVGTSASL